MRCNLALSVQECQQDDLVLIVSKEQSEDRKPVTKKHSVSMYVAMGLKNINNHCLTALVCHSPGV